MTANEHQEGLSAIVESISDALESITGEQQENIYKRIISLLNTEKFKLDLKPDGSIRATGANLRKISLIVARLRPYLFTATYKKVIERFSETFEKIERFNGKWFRGLGAGFTQKAVYRSVKDLAVERTILSINPEGFREALELPIREVLQKYVQSGGEILSLSAELEKGLKGVKDANGDRVLRGYLDTYHWRNRITKDTLFQYSRNYDQIVSENMGLEWFLYSGGIVKDSRDFCEEKAGNYYHLNEVLSWADQSWQGKARGTDKTNIQTELGGYNCQHSLRPVTLRLVPKDQVQRARDEGYYEG